MKILVIGNGGRESAIQWKLLQNKNVTKVYSHEDLQGIKTTKEYLQFALEKEIDLTIVGSEALLVEGIVDLFQEHGLSIFGPTQKAAMLEGSKVFSKEFMLKHKIKTASYGAFQEFHDALLFVQTSKYPLVIKADGLAAGKGVFIVNTFEEAKLTLQEIMVNKHLGIAGHQVVIEEYLEGIEASILSIYDGNKIIPFISAKDHKKIGEGETGLNTGGMGAVAPNPFVTEEVYQAMKKDIILPTETALKIENFDFTGVIFFGIMITKDGVYLLEYNMRLGDPETQAILPLMESDFLEVIEKALEGSLESIQWKHQNSCCVVLASGGYPGNFKTGYKIRGVDKIKEHVFLAGVKKDGDSLLTNGGRVLSVVALADTLEEATKKAYQSIESIEFEGKYYRKDIGTIDVKYYVNPAI